MIIRVSAEETWGLRLPRSFNHLYIEKVTFPSEPHALVSWVYGWLMEHQDDAEVAYFMKFVSTPTRNYPIPANLSAVLITVIKA